MVYFPYRSPFVLRSSSVHPPFILRSSSVRAPFILRSTSVRAPFELRSTSVQPPFNLRSGSVQAPFDLRSTSVDPPLILRSFSVQPPFGNRRSIEEWSKKYRRIIGGKTEKYRNSNGKPRERQPEQKTPKIPHKSHAPDFQKKTLKKLSTRKTLKINALPKNTKKFFKKTSQNIWSLLKNAVPLHSQIRNNAYHASKIAKCKSLKMSCEIDLWQELHKTFVEKYKRQMSIQKNVRVKVTCQFQKDR